MENEEVSMDSLKELDAMFEEIGGNDKLEENAGGYQDLEDGVYSAEIISAELKNSKKGFPMIDLTIGTDIGKQSHKYLMLASDTQEKTSRFMSAAVTDIQKFGIVEPTITKYVARLNELVGKQFTLEISTSKSGFVNKHITDVK